MGGGGRRGVGTLSEGADRTDVLTSPVMTSPVATPQPGCRSLKAAVDDTLWKGPAGWGPRTCARLCCSEEAELEEEPERFRLLFRDPRLLSSALGQGLSVTAV